MNKRYILMGFAGLLAITTVIGGTMAAFETRTEKPGVSVITTKNLDIGIFCNKREVIKNEDSGLVSFCIKPETDYCMPGTVITGGNAKGVTLPLEIINKTNSGYGAYIRVRIYKTWMDNDNDNVVKRSFLNKLGSKLENRQSDKKGFMPLPNNGNGGVLLSGWNNGRWIEAEDNDEENITLYYKYILEPGSSTDVFLDRIAFNEYLNNDFANKKVQFEIEADAVQALSDDSINKAAIESAWGMNATFASINEITDICD